MLTNSDKCGVTCARSLYSMDGCVKKVGGHVENLMICKKMWTNMCISRYAKSVDGQVKSLCGCMSSVCEHMESVGKVRETVVKI